MEDLKRYAKMLSKAEELTKNLLEGIDEVRKKEAEVNRTAANLRLERNKLESIQIDLEARENVVKNAEKIIHSNSEARRIRSENSTATAFIEKEKEILENKKSEFAKFVAKTRFELIQERNECGRLREELRSARMDIKEKEKNLKSKILDEIKKKI